MTHAKLKAGEVAGTYHVTSPVTESDIITMAKCFAKRKLAKGRKITQPSQIYDYLQVMLVYREREIFCTIFLDNMHRVICFEEMFLGSVDSIFVHPREVVKRALACNAASVILVHNHPNGDTSPSDADLKITLRLQKALELIEVLVIDHIIVGSEGCFSFTEKGCL